MSKQCSAKSGSTMLANPISRVFAPHSGGADDVPMVSPLVSGAIDEAQNQVQSRSALVLCLMRGTYAMS